MPDHDTAAAAERLRRIANPPVCHDEYDADLRTVAAAYLDLTDPTPIDAEWLKSIGFEQEIAEPAHIEYRIPAHEGHREYRFAIHTPSDRLGWSCCLEGESGYCELPNQFTRGQLRKLCAALGIPLTAAPRQEQQQ